MTEREKQDDALAAIGLTHHGEILIEVLETVQLAVAPLGIESSALHELEGGRRLARNLIEKLTRDHASAAGPDAQPRRSARISRGRGARRPVADTSGSGA
jgi:hypothetical protein